MPLVTWDGSRRQERNSEESEFKDCLLHSVASVRSLVPLCDVHFSREFDRTLNLTTEDGYSWKLRTAPVMSGFQELPGLAFFVGLAA